MMDSGANVTAIIFFALFIGLTLAITYWAARKTNSASEYLVAGERITAGQNGFALAGDYLSAGALLGVGGIITMNGFDGLLYSIGWLVGWPVILFLIAEPVRNLGKYTLTDAVSVRMQQRPVRCASALSTIAIVVFYLIAQMVAAGGLIKLFFGLPYEFAIVIVGVIMLLYVLFGGMIATTWVQIIKAVLLLGATCVLTFLVLGHFHMNPLSLFAAAAEKYGQRVLEPGDRVFTGRWDALSLAVALMFGTAGMPHILMRVYTVANVKQARMSIFYATCLIGAFHLMVLVIGYGAMVLVGPEVVKAAGGGGNMAAPLLAMAVGGNAFFGFISAVAFATMLAVVAGLTLSGAAALSHDLWVNVVRNGHASEREQLRVAKIASIVIGGVAIVLGIVFRGQNVAFTAGLAFSIACSANFPVLILSMFWRRYTTAGAVSSLLVGTIVCLVLIYCSPTVQIDVLGRTLAELSGQWWFFPMKNPALVTMPLAIAAGVLVSIFRPEPAAERLFPEMLQRILLGDETASPGRAALPLE